MPFHYENHVKTRECPKCGIQRPLDWFAIEGEPCWKCKNLAWKDKRTPEDGLLGSISKRHGKLDLAKQLDTAKARIESLEETLQEKTTKLRAAEEFARQSESERKSTASKIEPLEQSKKQLQANLKQEKARAATLEVRIEELENASRGRMAAYRRELIEEMQRQAVCASGGWSKARVLGFLGGFLPETEEVTSYDGSFIEEYDSEPEPRRSAKKA